MSSQGRPSWAAEPKQQDVLECLIEGYHVPLLSTFDPDVDKTEDNTGVFGYGGTIDTTILNRGTLNCEGIKDPLMQVLYDIASRQYPGATTQKTNIPRQCYAEMVRLRKSDDKTYYTEAEIYHKVNFVLPQAGGGPKERGRIAFSASCDISPTFVAPPGKGIAVTWDVVPLANNGPTCIGFIASDIALASGLQSNYDQIPAGSSYENSGKYALSVKVFKRTDDVINAIKSIPISTNTVTASAEDSGTAAVTVTASDLANTGMTVTDSGLYAHVMLLCVIDTPTVDGPYLIGQGITCRGLFDTP